MTQTNQLHWYAASSKPGTDLYELWKDEKKIMSLEFNQFSHTAKIDCLNTRRNFRIEKEGFLRNKTVLKNEYGVKVGLLGFEGWHNDQGFIELNDKRFYYTKKNKACTDLIIYKKNKKRPLLVCGFTEQESNASIRFEKDKDDDKYSCLLMALAWFLFMPIPKENELAFAL